MIFPSATTVTMKKRKKEKTLLLSACNLDKIKNVPRRASNKSRQSLKMKMNPNNIEVNSFKVEL